MDQSDPASQLDRSQYENEEMWRYVLTQRHPGTWSFLPGPSRCFGCEIPMGGVSGMFTRMIGYRPSRHNPKICSYCDDMLPPGGAEIDLGTLFADVRGSTTLSKRMGTRAWTKLMNRFYAVATDVLVERMAFIDKMAGDQVMGLFFPGATGPNYRCVTVESAEALLRAVGYRPDGEPWLPLAAAVHVGPAFAGKIGNGGVYQVTALGDTINMTAHLQALAAPGEILITEEAYSEVRDRYPDLGVRMVTLRGREEPMQVRVLCPAGVEKRVTAAAS